MSDRREHQIFINAPGLTHPHRRAGDQILTLLMWGIYAYLWLPFISLVAWYLGVDLFYEEMVLYGGFQAFLDLAGWYLLVIALILASVGTWSASNYLRFNNKNRRQKQPAASDADIAAWFGVDSAMLAAMRNNSRLELDFDEQGMLRTLTPAVGAPLHARASPPTAERRLPRENRSRKLS